MARKSRSLRKEQKEATREQILSAATKLLADHGYASFRVAAVAKEAGVSIGGHLHHFPSKDSLVIAVLERLSARVLDLVAQDAARDSTDGDILQLVADSADRFYTTPDFLIYLDIFLSVRRHSSIGDTAMSLVLAQRRATEALWLPHLISKGVSPDDGILVIRALWGLSRGLAISSEREHPEARRHPAMQFVIEAVRQTFLKPSLQCERSGEQAV